MNVNYYWVTEKHDQNGDHQLTTSAELSGAFLTMAGAEDDDDADRKALAIDPADWPRLVSYVGSQADWFYTGNGGDDSDLPEPTGSTGTAPRAHWGWYHKHRRWSDARTREKIRQLEDGTWSIATVGAILGLVDPPSAIASAAIGLGWQWFATRLSRARDDANGRGVTLDIGFRCGHIPLLPDPCLPAIWIKPIKP